MIEDKRDELTKFKEIVNHILELIWGKPTTIDEDVSAEIQTLKEIRDGNKKI